MRSKALAALLAIVLLMPIAAAHGANTYSFIMRSQAIQPESAQVTQNDTLIFHNTAEHNRSLLVDLDADGIDVLIDLTGHFTKNRLKLFARRAAPVQATWGGYTGTTGLAAMDYLIADPHRVPEGTDRDYTEEVIRLPDDYVCYTAPDYAPGVGQLPAATNGFVTFGCFNKPRKINAEVLAAWAEILNAVPGSRLLLKFKHMESPDIREPFSASLSAHGVDLERVDFEGHSPHKELLDCYNAIDIALDTFPYSGGLTTCEALWMGVPVVALPTETFASRHSLSHLSAGGLTEYVASDLSGYVRLAAELAGDQSRLAATRAGLRERVARSPLCDGPRFARHFATVCERRGTGSATRPRCPNNAFI